LYIDIFCYTELCEVIKPYQNPINYMQIDEGSYLYAIDAGELYCFSYGNKNEV